MGVPKAFERLAWVRSVEEEQRRRLLEAAVARLKSLEQARDAALQAEKRGRSLLTAGAIAGAMADRQAGLVEAETARRRARVLAAHITTSQKESDARRREFLEKRVERRQAETLVEEAQAREELESGRKSQQRVDDWYGARSHRQGADEDH